MKVLLVAGTALAVAAVILIAPRLDIVRWRLDVIEHKANGKIADLSWTELLRMLRPGSGYYLEELAVAPNPFAVIANPYASEPDIAAGETLFKSHCAGCHGLDASGGPDAPNLVRGDLRLANSAWGMYRVIQRGIPDSAMSAAPLSERQRWQIVGFVQNQRSADVYRVAIVDYDFPSTLEVNAERLLSASSEPDNWLTYSGRVQGWRYSELDAVNRDNVWQLRLAWVRQLHTREWIETSPVVVDGVMYFTGPPSDVWALDAATGEVIWSHPVEFAEPLSVCCGMVNRGVAILGNRVYVGTIDGRLLALDSRTGQTVWEQAVADPGDGYTLTVAPLAIDDKIIIGVSGGEFGIRGFLSAHDAETGEKVWQFNTVPGPGETGHDSWGGDSWKTGGGPTWVTGAFDPDLGLLYWGVGNPSPDFNGAVRPGDNLYTNSVVALDIDSGRLAWHFQFTPHDLHDYDSNQTPVLVDATLQGDQRKLILWANRNAFYYVLDRTDGRFLLARPFARQTWAEKIDAHGRPIGNPDAEPTPEGALAWPSAAGATNWWPPSYSPKAEKFFVSYLELSSVFFSEAPDRPVERREHIEYLGSAFRYSTDLFDTGVRALDPLSGEIIWDHPMPPRIDTPQVGGILSTAGGLVFMGNYETFYALSTDTGETLWSVQLGGRVNAAPITYRVDGKQYVAIAAGSSLYGFSEL